MTILTHGVIESALTSAPIPTAPPTRDPSLESFGLHLLSSAHQLQHVTRISESLSLIDATHAARKVSLDLNLESIPEDMKDALRDPGSSSIWLPLERHARDALAPTVVRDADGRVIPRRTGLETTRALAAGLLRLLRTLMESHPDSRRSGTSLFKVLRTHFRARWLLEAAILRVVEAGSISNPSVSTELRPSLKDDEPEEIRRLACETLRLVGDVDSPFYQLVMSTALQYFLVALVPETTKRVFLEFDAPLLPTRTRHESWLPLSKSEFTISYDSIVPRGVDSYHVTVSVPQEIYIRRFALTSDADTSFVNELCGDLEATATYIQGNPAGHNKLVELELQSIVSRLAELARRRRSDLNEYRAYLNTQIQPLRWPKPKVARPILDLGSSYPSRGAANVTAASALKVVASSKSLVKGLTILEEAYEAGMLKNLAAYIDPGDLRNIAELIRSRELQYDLYVENDPRENAAHAHWRRRPLGRRRPTSEPVQVRVIAVMADDRPSLASSVTWLLVGLIALVCGLYAFLHGTDGWVKNNQILGYKVPVIMGAPRMNSGPIGSADAIVTLLLLVPGLLLTRLDIPSHQTVLGRLRLLPRYLAYAGVTATYAVAVSVAAQRVVHSFFWFQLCLIVLFSLLAISLADGLVRFWRRRILSLSLKAFPTWLRREARQFIPLSWPLKVTARFSRVKDHGNA